MKRMDMAKKKFVFDKKGLKKSFKIVIPQVSANISSLNPTISSEVIELPIPSNNKKVYINKYTTLEIKDKFFKNSNNKVKIVSVQKADYDNFEVELQYDNINKDKIQIENCTIVPVGKSTSDKAKNWFEGGLHGGAVGKNGIEWTFKLPYPDAEKLYVKILGSEYIIKGPWEITID